MKVAGYIRVSTEEQTKGFGIEVQKEKILQFCKLNDIQDVEFYIDDGYSGWSLDRPAMRRLLNDIAEHKISKVIVYKSDRIARHLKDLLVLIEDILEPNGVEFISVTENFDTGTPQGKLFLQMLGSFAEFERNVIKERTLNGRIQKAKKNIRDEVVAGRIPYGYRKEGDKIVVDEYESNVIKIIHEMRSNGKSLREIANFLNSEGFRTRQGGKWYASTIKYMLENEKYCGWQKYKFANELITSEFIKIV